MSLKKTLLAAGTAALFALPALAGSQITIGDPYARAAGVTAIAGAAFFTIENSGNEDDRLIGAEADISKLVQLHTHIAGENGVMKMVEVPEGFPVPAHGEHALKRGGDHVMFMGLKHPLKDGEVIDLTLVFEKAGRIEVAVPVDNERKPAMSMDMGASSN